MAEIDRSVLDSGVAATEGQLKQLFRDILLYFDEILSAVAGGGLVLRGDYDNGTEYSMFDVVYDQEASWGYINETPSTGNDPPTLPTTSDSYWVLIARSPNRAGVGVHFFHDTEIPVGPSVAFRVPFPCTITKWSLLGDDVGDIVIDIWKSDYDNAPPTVSDSIVASAKPTLNDAQKAEDATLTGWDVDLLEGDVLIFNVDSVEGLRKVSLTLFVKRTNA